jgi:hypothetical protein
MRALRRSDARRLPAPYWRKTAVLVAVAAELKLPSPELRRSTAACGTLSGYNAHIRRGEELCEDCASEMNLYRRARYSAQSR